MFCVDIAPCWRRPFHVLARKGKYSSSQGGGQSTPGNCDCLRVNCGHVFCRSSGFTSNHRFIAAELFRMVQGPHSSGNFND